MIDHLKQQCTDGQIDSEKHSTLKIREATLESQVQQLLSELKDAKKNHTPVSS